MVTGNQTVLPDEGMTLSSATIIKPDTMIPENIKVGVDIGGVVGTAPTPKAEQTKTVDLDMAAGNQTISPDEGKVLSSAVVTKPTTLVAENIKKDINIGGVVGTLEESAPEQYITATYIANVEEMISATLHGYTAVPARQFIDQRRLESVMLPSGIVSIRYGAFSGCVKLSLTSLPSGITSIGDGVFFNCTNLALTSLPSGITSIGTYSFQNCTNLALTSLPSGLTNIGNGLFHSCTSLALTELPSGLTGIGEYAFYGCTGLTSIIFRGTPTTISSTAFRNCINLTDIKVPWAEGAVANAPWGAINATITYNYTA